MARFSAPAPQGSIVVVSPTGAHRAFKDDELVAAGAYAADTAGSVVLIYCDCTAASVPSAVPSYVAVGTRTVTIDDTKANCTAFAAKCAGIVVVANDGAINREFQSGQYVPIKGTKTEINALTGDVGGTPADALAVTTDTNELRRMAAGVAGGNHFAGVPAPLYVRRSNGEFVILSGIGQHTAHERWLEILDYFDSGWQSGDVLYIHDYVSQNSTPCALENTGDNARTVEIHNYGGISVGSGSLFEISGQDSPTTLVFHNYHHVVSFSEPAIFLLHGGASLFLCGGTPASVITLSSVGNVYLSSGKIIEADSPAAGDVNLVAGAFTALAPGAITLDGQNLHIGPSAVVDLSLVSGAGSISYPPFLGHVLTGGVLPPAVGGTGNGFTKFIGPTTSERKFTLPDVDATLLHGTPNGIVKGDGSGGTSAAVAGVDYSPPLLPPYIAGDYYTQTGVVSATTSANTNQRMFLVQFRARQRITVDGIMLSIPTTSGSGGQLARAGIYGITAAGEPDLANLLRETGTLDISSSGEKLGTFADLVIDEGQMVYLAATADGTTVQFRVESSKLQYEVGGVKSGNNGNATWVRYVASVNPSSSLPSSGSITAATFLANVPLVYLRVKSVP